MFPHAASGSRLQVLGADGNLQALFTCPVWASSFLKGLSSSAPAARIVQHGLEPLVQQFIDNPCSTTAEALKPVQTICNVCIFLTDSRHGEAAGLQPALLALLERLLQVR